LSDILDSDFGTGEIDNASGSDSDMEELLSIPEVSLSLAYSR
jgi:hypothetical protein